MIVPLQGKGGVFGAITFIYAQSAREYTQADLEFAEELARRAALIIERRLSSAHSWCFAEFFAGLSSRCFFSRSRFAQTRFNCHH